MNVKKRLNNLKFLDDTIKSKRQEIFALESLVQKRKSTLTNQKEVDKGIRPKS